MQDEGSPQAAGVLGGEELAAIHAYWRAANYLSVGQIYLLDNPLLREPLSLEHDMVMLNDMDRFHLVVDVIDRVPGLGERAAHLRQAMVDERLRHRAYTRATGDNPPDVRLDVAGRPRSGRSARAGARHARLRSIPRAVPPARGGSRHC